MKSIFVVIFFFSGCATLDSDGEKVRIVSHVDGSCQNYGPVSVRITSWGLPEECRKRSNRPNLEESGIPS